MKTRILFLVLSFILVGNAYGAQITLTWQDNSGQANDAEEGFTIERNDNNAGWKALGAVKSNVTTYVDNTLVVPPPANPPAKNSYCFRVVAFNHGPPVPPATQGPLQTAPPSNIECVDVLGVAAIGPPAAASNLTASPVTGLSAAPARAKPAAKKK